MPLQPLLLTDHKSGFTFNKPYTFHSIDCETPNVGLTAARPFPFNGDPEERWIVSHIQATTYRLPFNTGPESMWILPSFHQTPIHSLTGDRPFPFHAGPENISILSSLHGLLCVGITTETVTGVSCLDITTGPVEYSDLILWNPLTGEYKTLC
ncbi:hypothetical protein L2E82_44578 [Cichorium intybus]|uniref:Uncharacterized protein n=1 Tax=Cichorium intybus TaxID=13427 RepID=A0ACB8ZQU5_CICIN|nr:hypothetical protein L2E82_44578 [Cichorium intybus]